MKSRGIGLLISAVGAALVAGQVKIDCLSTLKTKTLSGSEPYREDCLTDCSSYCAAEIYNSTTNAAACLNSNVKDNCFFAFSERKSVSLEFCFNQVSGVAAFSLPPSIFAVTDWMESPALHVIGSTSAVGSKIGRVPEAVNGTISEMCGVAERDYLILNITDIESIQNGEKIGLTTVIHSQGSPLGLDKYMVAIGYDSEVSPALIVNAAQVNGMMVNQKELLSSRNGVQAIEGSFQQQPFFSRIWNKSNLPYTILALVGIAIALLALASLVVVMVRRRNDAVWNSQNF